jgi:hypothetical protein
MNNIRVLKIVAALCIWAICFILIPTIIGPEHFALQMGFYAVFSIIMLFLFYQLFKEILNKDRSGLPVYDYSKEQPVVILISPARVSFLSMVMILLSAAVITLLGVGGVLQKFRWTLIESYPPLIPLLVFCFIFFKGIQLWTRRNEVVQLRLSDAGLDYMPVDVNGVGRGRAVSILTMYFRTKMVSLHYNNIDAIEIDKNERRGDMIRITTVSHLVIFLPFLPNDINQLEAVYATFVERWKNKAGGTTLQSF